MDSNELEIYLRQIRRTPLLTAEQEAIAVRKLESRRHRLRFKLLCSPYVLQGAMQLLRQVAAGELRAERVIEVDVRDLAKKRRCVAAIEPVLSRTQALHVDCVQAYEDLLQCPGIDGCRRYLCKRRELIRGFEQLEVRLERLWELATEVISIESPAVSPSPTVNRECDRQALATREAKWARTVILAMKSYAQAKNCLVAANLPLVISVAKRYHRQGRDLLDLVQEGNMGLLRAADKFRSSFRGRFTTYAVWWIRQALQRVVQRARLVRPSHDAASCARQIENCGQLLSHEIGREPTWAEVAAAMGLDERTAEQASNILRPVLPAESEVGASRTGLFSIPDPAQDPSELAHFGMLRERLGQLMSNLDDRAYQVVALRYGWDGRGKRTLVEISGMLGVSRARVSQIEQATLKKLGQQLMSPTSHHA